MLEASSSERCHDQKQRVAQNHFTIARTRRVVHLRHANNGSVRLRVENLKGGIHTKSPSDTTTCKSVRCVYFIMSIDRAKRVYVCASERERERE